VHGSRTLRIARCNAATGGERSYEQYSVEVSADTSVLAALDDIAAHKDETLSFRSSCGHGVCGSCSMMVNGEPRLACSTFLRDYEGTIVIEPLAGFPVLRDLNVDLDLFFDKFEQAGAYLAPLPEAEEVQRNHRQGPEDLALIDPYSACMLCAICYAACPKFRENPDYMGPAALVAAHRYNEDSRDGGAGFRLASMVGEGGIFECAANEGCSLACPKGIDNAAALQGAKLLALLNELGIARKPTRARSSS
jgi:fumarate reductase iron-sulfur subunit